MPRLKGSKASSPGDSRGPIDLISLVDHREAVQMGTTVERVNETFRTHPKTYMAVLDGEVYAGLTSRGHLGALLGSRFGFALLARHLIQEHLIPGCLVAVPSMPLLDLLQQALARPGEAFYQDVPLVDAQGRFLGIIPVPALVRAQSALVQEQFQLAENQRRELLAKNQDLFRSFHQFRQSQGRYETLFQNSPLAVALLFPDGRIDTPNRKLETMLGSGRAAGDTAPSLAELMPAKDREAFLGLLRLHESGALASGHQTDTFHLRLPGSEERLFRFHTSLVQETGQICTILQDITEQRALDQRMALNDKTALVESLAGGIAHELNNTLTPVLGYAELLGLRLEDAGNQPVLQTYCRSIASSAQDAVHIIRQLLQLSRPATSEFRPVDLGEVLGEAVSIMRFRLRAAETALTLKVPDGRVRVLADAVQIKQVLINLMINAVDAMEHAPRKELQVRMETRGGQVEVSVRDTGHGIPPEKLNRIFDPFFTTKSAERGTGLGLSVCLGIIGQHRGEIAVDSVPGEGTVFRILLPLAPEEDPGAAQAPRTLDRARPPAAGSLAAGPRLDVLVIDDEEFITNLVHELLRTRLGWRVEQVHEGQEAIRRLERTPFDLVITDLRMPGLDGFAILGWIKDFRPALLPRVLVVTGDTGSPSLDQELQDLKVTLLRKPFTPDELVAQCRELAAASWAGH